jgi:hypothetical protein
MSEEILISFIVPVYNAEKTISRCLDSILNQSLQNFEIIVVNDGSNDNVQSVINEYVLNYPSIIKSYEKQNAGPGDTRNYGIEKSKGKYIAFVDSDDSIEFNYTKIVTELIDEHKADMVIINYNRMYNKKQNIFERFYKFSNWKLYNIPLNISDTPEMIGKLEVAVWLRVIKKEILTKQLFFSNQIKLAEDLEASLKWYVSAKRIIVSPEKIYNYLISANSLNFSSNNVEQFSEVINGVYNYFNKNNLKDKCYAELEYIFIKHILISNLLRLRVTDRKDKFKVFMLLRSSLIQYFPKYAGNKYLKSEPFYLRIAVYFSFNFPGIYRLIL